MITLVVRAPKREEIEEVHKILNRSLAGAPAYVDNQIMLPEVDLVSTEERKKDLESGRFHYQELYIGETSHNEDIELVVPSHVIQGLTHHDLFAELFAQMRQSA